MSALVAAHAFGAGVALLVGPVVLARRKGDRRHRMLGRVWLLDMYWVSLSSFGITELRPGSLSWIHGLSAFTVVMITLGWRAAVRGRVALHRRRMVGSYLGLVGAFLGAVAVPQRAVPQLVVHRPLVAALAAAAVAAVAYLLAGWGRPANRPSPGGALRSTSRV